MSPQRRVPTEPAPARAGADGPHVIVIGAGLAGLTAAWRLARQGVHTTLLEREPEPGGRARSVVLDGVESDATAPAVSVTDRRLLGLVEEAGLADRMLPLRSIARFQLHRGQPCLVDPVGWLGIASLPGIPLLQGLRAFRLERLMRRYRPQLEAEAPERAASLDDRSLEEFGRLYFGRAVVERWMEPTLAEMAVEADADTSRVGFLLQHQTGHWTPPGTFAAPLVNLVRGLAAGVALRTGAELERIEPREAGGFVVRTREGGRPRAREADAVVLACSAAAAARTAAPLLERFERDFLLATRSRALVAAALRVRSSLARVTARLRIPAAEAPPFLFLHVVPGKPADAEPTAVTALAREAWSLAHLDAPEDARLKEIVHELAFLAPGIGEAVVDARTQVYRESLPRFDVGRYRALARWRGLQLELRREGRRLYFCGDYLVAPSLEGAVVSGERAAREVGEDLSRRARRS